MKSGTAPGSVGSSGSSGMSEVMDLLEAESQAYLDGLLERALPTWDKMLQQLNMVWFNFEKQILNFLLKRLKI